MIGKKFNSWTIIDGPLPKKKGYDKYLCRCTCGLEKPVAINMLQKGSSKQCRDCSSRAKILKFPVGEKIHYWTVIGELVKRNSNYFQLCRCCCGKESFVRPTMLQTNRSKHCHRCPKLRK